MSDLIYKRIMQDLQVELSEEFDRNFERKAFFDQPWPSVKIHNRRGSLMIRSGYLRRSLRSSLVGNELRFTSSAIFAEIQNSGGQIRVTGKMKRFFWAMYYKASRGGKKPTAESNMWKGMALKPVGSMIKIPARQFIGSHPQVTASVERVVGLNLTEVENYMNTIFKKR
jgi:phage gpG-like protein